MNVLVIEPGHGSLWLDDAVYVDRMGKPNPRGRYVQGTTWWHESGFNIPEGGINIPETATYPRKWVLAVEENGVVVKRTKIHGKNGYPRIEGRW